MLNKKIILNKTLTFSTAFSLFFIIPSCSSGGTITVANFESYMSPDVISKIKKDRDITSSLRFSYYATNEDIQTKFKKYYDVAIPSSYEAINLLLTNQLAKIDWNQFNLKQIDDNGDPTDIPITKGIDALNLFSDQTKQLIETENEYIGSLNLDWWDNANDSILDYAIPYFTQDWLFAYKTQEINGLQNENRYSELFKYISPTGTNFNSFFDGRGSTKKIGMIDDSRTVFDFCQLLGTENSDDPTIDFDDNSPNENSKMFFTQTYENLTNKYTPRYFYFNTDSGGMSNSLATPLSKGGLNSAFTYNGDILYAAMGGDLNAGINKNDPKYIQYFSGSDNSKLLMNIYRPEYVPTFMDMMVINKKNSNMQRKKTQNIYKFIYKICLDSANEKPQDINTNFEELYTTLNWTTILYIEPLFETDKWVKESYLTSDNFANYDLLKQIYGEDNEEEHQYLLEKPINDIAKLHMYLSYIEQKTKL